jgi:hypothetical protein
MNLLRRRIDPGHCRAGRRLYVAAALSKNLIPLVRRSDQGRTTEMKAVSAERAAQSVLLANIGGTNAHFAILAAGMVRELS